MTSESSTKLTNRETFLELISIIIMTNGLEGVKFKEADTTVEYT